jgi:hypothetical protein
MCFIERPKLYLNVNDVFCMGKQNDLILSLTTQLYDVKK